MIDRSEGGCEACELLHFSSKRVFKLDRDREEVQWQYYYWLMQYGNTSTVGIVSERSPEESRGVESSWVDSIRLSDRRFAFVRLLPYSFVSSVFPSITTANVCSYCRCLLTCLLVCLSSPEGLSTSDAWYNVLYAERGTVTILCTNQWINK